MFTHETNKINVVTVKRRKSYYDSIEQDVGKTGNTFVALTDIFNRDPDDMTENKDTSTQTTLLNRSSERKNNEALKSIAKEILYNSTGQAVIKISQTPHIVLKFFLIFCLTLAGGLSLYLVGETVVGYYEYEVFTTTRTIFETSVLYPKITICNNNPFTTEYALDFLRKVNQNCRPDVDIFDHDQMKKLNASEKIKVFEQIVWFARTKMNSPSFSDADRKKLGHDLNDILLRCTFNNQKCTSQDFIWKFDKWLGNCYVFNSDFNSSGDLVELKRSDISGSVHGLQVDYYVNYFEDLTPLNSRFGLGALIRIENNSYATNVIKLAPGFETSVSIDRTFKFNLPKPYSNCDVDNTQPNDLNSDLYKLIAHSVYEYDQQLCFTQCLQKLIIDACNCTSPHFLSLFEAQQPESIEQKECIVSMYSSSNNFINENCLPLCPLECNKTEYKTSISFQIIGDWFVDYINDSKMLSADFIKKPINSHTTKESVVKVNAFYDSLSYTISTEAVKMNWVLLLANIGGTLGLFLGISVLSLCEIAEVLIEIYYVRKEEEKVYGIL